MGPMVGGGEMSMGGGGQCSPPPPPPQPTIDRRHEILRYCAEEDRDTGHGRYRHDRKELCSY